MSFLQLVSSLDKTIRDLILFCRQCHSDPYRNKRWQVKSAFQHFKVVKEHSKTNILSYSWCRSPQTKLRKGSVFTPVCQSFCSWGGGCLAQCMLGYTPWADTPPGRHPLGQHPPWADTLRADIPPEQTAPGQTPLYPVHAGIHPRPVHAGIHSAQCMQGLTWLLLQTVHILLECILVRKLCRSIFFQNEEIFINLDKLDRITHS